MASTIGRRTPPPRLVDIRSQRPQSMGTLSSINPTLLSRRRTSISHTHGTIDTVPELIRFNSSGTKSSVRTRPRQTTSQSYGSLNTISPLRERETMKDLSDFLMTYDPPAYNLVAPPQSTPRKKFGLLRRKQKEPKPNQFLRLPDTAISAKTRQGVKYIAISIPLEHDYLGGLPTPPKSGNSYSQLGRTSTVDRAPVVVLKPVSNIGDFITSPPDLSALERRASNSKRDTWGPGTLTKVITKPGSEGVMLRNGYIHRTSQVHTPTGSIYHDAPERPPMTSPTKAIPSSGPPFKETLTDNLRTNPLNSASRPILWRHSSEGPLRVINRTPSPDIKPVYQTHKVTKSISTIHSVATTGTGIRQSLKSTPDSFKTNSSTPPAVFGTAETIDLQSFRGITPRPSFASPQTETNLQFPVASPVEPESAFADQSPSLITSSSVTSPEICSTEKQADQAAQMNRREKPPTPSSPNTKSIEPPSRSSKPFSQEAAVLSTSNIMLVADLPPFVDHIYQSDINPSRHLSPSRLPRPNFLPTKSLNRHEKGKSVHMHHATQTILSHEDASRGQWHISHRGRPNSEPFVYSRLEFEDGNLGWNLDLDLDAGRVRERRKGMGMGIRCLKERELDVRMRIIERDTDVLLRTLRGIARSFDNLGKFGRMGFGMEEVNGSGVGVGSGVSGRFGEGMCIGNGNWGERDREDGKRKRAATTGMENRSRDGDMLAREIQREAPKNSKEVLRVGEEEKARDGEEDGEEDGVGVFL